MRRPPPSGQTAGVGPDTQGGGTSADGRERRGPTLGFPWAVTERRVVIRCLVGRAASVVPQAQLDPCSVPDQRVHQERSADLGDGVPDQPETEVAGGRIGC